jgi:hypothetical protein
MTRDPEKHHNELRKFLAVDAARNRIRLGWTMEDACRTAARLHGLPLERVFPWVDAAETACAETRRQIAAMTSRESGWQPRKLDALS